MLLLHSLLLINGWHEVHAPAGCSRSQKAKTVAKQCSLNCPKWKVLNLSQIKWKRHSPSCSSPSNAEPIASRSPESALQPRSWKADSVWRYWTHSKRVHWPTFLALLLLWEELLWQATIELSQPNSYRNQRQKIRPVANGSQNQAAKVWILLLTTRWSTQRPIEEETSRKSPWRSWSSWALPRFAEQTQHGGFSDLLLWLSSQTKSPGTKPGERQLHTAHFFQTPYASRTESLQ